jgi:ketosteroid isomerase-like protein
MAVVSMRRVLLCSALAVLPAPFLLAQLPAGERQARHDQLIAADRAVADTAMALGFAEAIGRAAEPEFVLVYPGAPVIGGREAARQLLDAQGALKSLTLRWVPLHAEVSGDGSFGVTYGVTGIASSSAPPAGPLRFGKYLSAWKRTGEGWKLVGHVEVGLLPGASYTAPSGFAVPALTALPTSGPIADFARADRQFAALAGKQGAPSAFAAFAAGDAVTFAGTGELARGPAAIRQWLRGDESAWSWRPVAGGGTADLGFTVGESVITGKGEAPSYGKYLTLWRREAGGAIRYIADGGNGRPAPNSP